MIRALNKFVDKMGLSAAQAYTDFGVQQLDVVNTQVSQWLERQSFADYAPSPQYGEMRVGGESRDWSLGRDTPDRVEWNLRFHHQIDPGVGGPWSQRNFSGGLVHVERLPSVSKYNSEPGLFSTEDYIRISISNGERGWVEKGDFPVGPGMSDGAPAFIDTKRDAKAAFGAAREWAKFRTMAVASSGYILDKLKAEEENARGYNDEELMRSRSQESIRLMLELLPDTRTQTGPTALRHYYEPGILEATVALELERDLLPQFGRVDGGRSVYNIWGSPIEIIPVGDGRGKYDATLQVKIAPNWGVEDEKVNFILQRELQESSGDLFQTVSGRSELSARLHVPNAHKVRQAIQEGREDTFLHHRLKRLSEVVGGISSLCGSWKEEQMPVLRETQRAMMEAAKEEHFKRIRRAIH